jgi:glycosidase
VGPHDRCEREGDAKIRRSQADAADPASRVGPAQARVAAMLLLTLRGTPTIYQGEEIGMADVPIPASLVQDPFERNVPGERSGSQPDMTTAPLPLRRNALGYVGL